ncbi:MAG: hypothetical protein JST76_07460, partial [Bacteroidetes bacterium]|nr:hypothetical protein [Bacteroidota bacterium]
MKKLILLLAVAVLIGGSGCRKAYTCHCYNNNTTGTINYTVKAASSMEADINCALKDNDSLSCS